MKQVIADRSDGHTFVVYEEACAGAEDILEADDEDFVSSSIVSDPSIKREEMRSDSDAKATGENLATRIDVTLEKLYDEKTMDARIKEWRDLKGDQKGTLSKKLLS